jgi:hypothetical protein
MQETDSKNKRVALVTLTKDCRRIDDPEILQKSLVIELKSKLGKHSWNVERVEVAIPE